MNTIEKVEQLETLYGQPSEASLIKETRHIIPRYAAFIDASPFVALATSGPEGLDCSPHGDRPGFVRIHNDRTLMLPDRRGNNRVDSLRNVLRDPRVGLLFMVPGSGNTLRINGTAKLSIDPALLASFAVDGKAPRSVMVIKTEAVYFQCSSAIVRSNVWSDEARIDPKMLPTPVDVLKAVTNGSFDGAAYDSEWPERAKKTLW